MEVWQPFGGELASLLGFIAMPLSWLSLHLIARNRVAGWWWGLVGDVVWLGACLDSGALSFVINDLVFMSIRVQALIGVWVGRRTQEEDGPPEVGCDREGSEGAEVPPN
jgi:hypothetical protein